MYVCVAALSLSGLTRWFTSCCFSLCHNIGIRLAGIPRSRMGFDGLTNNMDKSERDSAV